MVATQRLIPSYPTLTSDLERDIHPDRQVQSRECLRMDESDEVDDEHFSPRYRLRLAEFTPRPVVPTEAALTLLTEGSKDFVDESTPIDSIPVARSTMRS